MDKIRIGTRGSKLALWQAHYVEERLKAAGHGTEIVTIETKGDKILDRTLAKVGSKGIFTEEIEEQLISGEIDIAVHSAKDLQSELAAHFEIIAFTEREKPHDVLVSFHSGLDLSRPVTIGTSSVRRTALFHHHFPHIKVASVRGNLQTRMRKLREGGFDALALAYAGVARMGYSQHIRQHLPVQQFFPPVGQGTVAIEAHISLAPEIKQAVRGAVNHTTTEAALLGERAFLKTLQGGCSIPAFAHAQHKNGILFLVGGIVSADGKRMVKTEMQCQPKDAAATGHRLAEWVLGNGGTDILKELRESN